MIKARAVPIESQGPIPLEQALMSEKDVEHPLLRDTAPIVLPDRPAHA